MKALRNDRTAPAPCWAVIAYRWGWINNHQYIVRVTNDLQAARDAADAEAAHRGGKYSVTVWDNEGSAVHHASSCYGEPKAHVNYRVDMMESVGCAVVAALEDGHPLTTDQIAERWKRDVKTQEIMESVDRNQSNAHALAEERSDDSQQRVVGGGIDHAS